MKLTFVRILEGEDVKKELAKEITTLGTLRASNFGYPTNYIFRCKKCKHQFTSDKYPEKCPKCKGGITRVGLAHRTKGPIVLPIVMGGKL